jgi:predicted signal transduction protein with EAL and GGDEF domain
MSVVAEGVETVEQHQTLTTLGADACQGYYFARPMPARAINALIAQRPTTFPNALVATPGPGDELTGTSAPARTTASVPEVPGQKPASRESSSGGEPLAS